VHVTAVLFGGHRAFLPPGAGGEGSVVVHVAGREAPLSAVVDALGMPTEVGRIALLDGQPIGDDHVLHDGAVVTFVAPLGGG